MRSVGLTLRILWGATRRRQPWCGPPRCRAWMGVGNRAAAEPYLGELGYREAAPGRVRTQPSTVVTGPTRPYVKLGLPIRVSE